MTKSDVQCAQRAAVRCEKCHCCGIPSPGKSGSSKIVSYWGPLKALREQEGEHEEKRCVPQKCSSSLFLTYGIERREERHFTK